MKKDNMYCFVILHYLTINDTIFCVDSIKKCFNDYNYRIIIVDNGSNNSTGEQLVKEYLHDEKVKVILNNENLGFAKGNNIGFQYAKNVFKSDFIIMINNDTYFCQKEFLSIINDCYNELNFAVMGPKIILKDNSVHNMNEGLRSIDELKKGIKRLKLNRLLNKIHLLAFCQKIKSKIKLINKTNKTNEKNQTKLHNEIKKNVMIHGCCLIFSKIYIDRFDGIPDLTFLYCEEDLLYIRILKNNMLSLYNPFAEIHHNEDSSTNELNKNSREKNDFVFRNLIVSDTILLQETKKLKEMN